jgi:hypothetical protein
MCMMCPSRRITCTRDDASCGAVGYDKGTMMGHVTRGRSFDTSPKRSESLTNRAGMPALLAYPDGARLTRRDRQAHAQADPDSPDSGPARLSPDQGHSHPARLGRLATLA